MQFSFVADPDGTVEAKMVVLEGTLFVDFVSRTVSCGCVFCFCVGADSWLK